MAKIKKEEKTTKEASKETLVSENSTEILKESKEVIKKGEKLSQEEIIAKKELREKIESMSPDDSLKQQVQIQAQQIKPLQNEKKIKYLLEITKEKGVVYAVNVAKQMNDAYILDSLHDILAKEGYYKNFIK